MELIITEKDNAARRIADILSDGSATTKRHNGVNVYSWGGRRCIGLSGHVVGLDFPSEYSDWRDVQPIELVDAEVVKTETRGNIVAALRSLARKAETAIIATDYDREGELIGKEAYELIHEEITGPIQRVRFSSITNEEVQSAFESPEEIDFDLAAAGEARQIIDLLWGASLTRFLSLSAKQLGNDFISVGRVQSPTLKLIVDREREIEAFDPEDYWELFAALSAGEPFEAQYFYREDGTENERVWDEETATTVNEQLTDATDARVDSVRRRTRTDKPPTPFNTTQYIRAAGSIGFSAQQAMSIAEELYTAGYITYPRTDNTVYPDDLDHQALLDAFAAHPNFGEDARTLLELEDSEPTQGDTETTDHPPIHPTGEFPDDLGEDERQVYELVVRRFFATLAEPATWQHLKVIAIANDCRLKANGKRLVEPGYHDVYPYHSTSENYVPSLEEGDILDITDVQLEAKQTQPPRRRGQSRLIETMEDIGIGTKCLTEDTPVLIKQDGDVERLPVGELFNDERVVMADGAADIAVVENGPTTLSFNEITGQIDERTQTFVSRRSLAPRETVYTVATEAGSFSATETHPVYCNTEEGVETRTVEELSPGDELLSERPVRQPEGTDETAVSWEAFAADCTNQTKLYGIGCNDDFRAVRTEHEETRTEMAERPGTHWSQLRHDEKHDKAVPVGILGESNRKPEQLHGLNDNRTFENPFPIEWTPELARVIGTYISDGPSHVNESENVVDIRSHTSDRRLLRQFVSDIQTVFGIELQIEPRDPEEPHHKQRYQVQLPCAVGRILRYVIDTVTETGCPRLPAPLQPAFVGALFDADGHFSSDEKAFISNIDHDLLRGIDKMLANHSIDANLDANQHKLSIQGRTQLERFLNTIPITAAEKFHRGLSGLREYPATMNKAQMLRTMAEQPHTSAELAEELDLSRACIRTYLRELRPDGYVQTHGEGSNRDQTDNRTIRYSTDQYENSVYATVLGEPSSVTVTAIRERDYDGPVYDLTIDETAPNFAIEGGIIVHNSTRHNTLQKLYDRGYIEGDPPRPTALARGVVEAAEEFADLIVSEEMTAQLEEDMTAIAEGKATLKTVTDESREMLQRVFKELQGSHDEIGSRLREALKADKALGPCPVSGETLLVRRSRYGSYFVGCDGYPDCEYTLALPNKGEPLVMDETCEEHDLHHVKMLAGRDTFVHGCPQCAADAADATEDRIIGACPACGEEHGGELAIKQLRTGSRLVGCARYPDCEYSLPLPRHGEIVVTDTVCEEHDLPHLEVHDEDDDEEPWELGCPICNYEEYQERHAVSTLRDIDGIGEKTVEKLESAGITSIEELQAATAEEVASEVSGVSADRIREWQAQAAA